MLILLPIGLLLAAALAITIQDYFRPKFGTSWLIAVSAAIISWLMILVMRLRLPTTLKIFTWSQSEINLMGHFSHHIGGHPLRRRPDSLRQLATFLVCQPCDHSHGVAFPSGGKYPDAHGSLDPC